MPPKQAQISANQENAQTCASTAGFAGMHVCLRVRTARCLSVFTFSMHVCVCLCGRCCRWCGFCVPECICKLLFIFFLLIFEHIFRAGGHRGLLKESSLLFFNTGILQDCVCVSVSVARALPLRSPFPNPNQDVPGSLASANTLGASSFYFSFFFFSSSPFHSVLLSSYYLSNSLFLSVCISASPLLTRHISCVCEVGWWSLY